MSKIKFSGTAKRLTGGIAAVVILAVCLTVTTFALVYAAVSVENNIFRTGQVKAEPERRCSCYTGARIPV